MVLDAVEDGAQTSVGPLSLTCNLHVVVHKQLAADFASMSEFDEGVLELRHAKEFFVFSYLLEMIRLALFGIQTRGKVERLGLSSYSIVVFGVVLRSPKWRHDNPRHIDELEVPPFFDLTHERITLFLSGSNLDVGYW